MRQTFPSLTGLRLIAALAVLVAHCIALIVKLPDPTEAMNLAVTLASLGMSLFFVLSGFVIHSNYSENVSTPAGLWNFFVARFARLFPLYIAFLCFDLLMRVGFHQTNFERLKALPFYLTLTQSWIYFPLDGNALVYQFGLVPQVTWSISTEWFFYLAFPFLCLLMTRLQYPRSIVASIIALCLGTLVIVTLINLKAASLERLGVRAFGEIAANPQDGLCRWLAYFSPYVRIFEFALGCLISALIRVLPDPTPDEQRFGARLLVGALISIVILCYLFSSPTMPGIITSLRVSFGFVPCLATIIFCCARYENSIITALSAPRIVLAGEASYSIYLSHMVVLGAFRYETSTITDAQVWIATVLQSAVAIAATVGLSLVLWSLIEMPARRSLRKWLSVCADGNSEAATLSGARGFDRLPIQESFPRRSIQP
jgi:peptidoglycan/LPS O-acetylase OafA/YrhL